MLRSENEVTEKICHSARSEAKSQNLLQNHQIVILREVKRSRRIYWKTIELSFCAEQSEVAESLLYQNISTIPLNRAHELNFQPDF